MNRLDHNKDASFKLHEDERKQLRESLLAYIDKNPAKTADQDSSSHTSSPSNVVTHTHTRSKSKHVVTVALVAGILLVGAGISVVRSDAFLLNDAVNTLDASSYSETSQVATVQTEGAASSSDLYLEE